jgi:hypothetical protein
VLEDGSEQIPDAFLIINYENGKRVHEWGRQWAFVTNTSSRTGHFHGGALRFSP